MTTALIYFMLFSFYCEKVLGFKYNLFRGLSLMNLSIYLLIFVWTWKVAAERKPFDPNNVNKYLILMILVMLLSIPIKMLLGEISNVSVLKEIIYLKSRINPFIIFFVVFNTLSDVKTCKRALFALLLFMAFTLSTALLNKYGITEFAMLNVHKMGRTSGFGNPNAYASYLVLFFPLVLSYHLFRRELFTKISAGALSIMAFIGLLITGSRGGVLSFLFSMAIYLLILKKKTGMAFSRTVKVLCLILLIVGASVAFTPSGVRQVVVERFARFSDTDDIDYSTGHRTFLWANGLRLFTERPIIGHGLGTVGPLMEKKFGMAAVAHNEFINYMIEFGIIGLAIYLMIFWKMLQHVRKHLSEANDSWSKYLYISYVAGLSGWTFSMLGVQLWFPSHFFWLYTAVIYKYSQYAPIPTSDLNRNPANMPIYSSDYDPATRASVYEFK